jgi:hypothetical protein
MTKVYINHKSVQEVLFANGRMRSLPTGFYHTFHTSKNFLLQKLTINLLFGGFLHRLNVYSSSHTQIAGVFVREIVKFNVEFIKGLAFILFDE